MELNEEYVPTEKSMAKFNEHFEEDRYCNWFPAHVFWLAKLVSQPQEFWLQHTNLISGSARFSPLPCMDVFTLADFFPQHAAAKIKFGPWDHGSWRILLIGMHI